MAAKSFEASSISLIKTQLECYCYGVILIKMKKALKKASENQFFIEIFPERILL